MARSKTALVTGASSGIGKALAERFAAGGYDLVLAARSVDKMRALAGELASNNKIRVEVIGVDLADAAGAEKLFDEVSRRGLVIDALVNNAGHGLFGEFKDSALADQLAMMDLNMRTLVALTRLFLPGLVARKGKLLNVASTASFQPGPMMAVYCASKAFVLSFSEAIAEELAGDGVTVTALCPGATASGFQDRAAMQESALVKDKRLMTSAEVAAIGYDAFVRGQRVVIPGAMNWIMAQAIRITPRRVATAVAMSMMRRA